MLAPLERIEAHFLRDVGLTIDIAFDKFNLAPLAFRRDVAMLGLLHKCALGLAHDSLQALVPAAPQQHQRLFSTRLAGRRHNRQLLERCRGDHLDVLARSVFGLVRVYNLLKQVIVNAPTIKSFQRRLTKAAHERSKFDAKWATMYSPRIHSFLNNVSL